MKRSIIGIVVGISAILSFGSDIPLEYDIQRGVTFYLDFDREVATASRSAGENQPVNPPKKKPTFAEGVKGKGLKPGKKGLGLCFKLKKNLSFEGPGSISIWVKPVKWKYPKDMPIERNGHRRRLFQAFFLTNYQQSGYLGFQRMSSHKVKGLDSLSFWIGGFKGVSGGFGKGFTWKDGEWHNVVLTWDPLQFKLYLDGELKGQCTVQRKLLDKEISKLFTVACPPKTMIDEFIIYNRLLTSEEVKKYYQFYAEKD